MSKLSSNQEDRVIRALKLAKFGPGDRALYIIYRRGEQLRVPVTIVGLVLDVPSDEETNSEVRVPAFVVASDLGGRLTVPAGELRHGSALDRLRLALDD